MSRSAQRRACNSANRAIDLIRHGGFPKVDTHYVAAFTTSHPDDPELQRAICGRYIFPPNPISGHSVDPSCFDCRRWLEQNVDQLPAKE